MSNLIICVQCLVSCLQFACSRCYSSSALLADLLQSVNKFSPVHSKGHTEFETVHESAGKLRHMHSAFNQV